MRHFLQLQRMVQILLAIAASSSWTLFQMDVKNAFFHGNLREDVYMRLPLGLSSSSSAMVCKLQCSFYGLKQALRAWVWKILQNSTACLVPTMSIRSVTFFVLHISLHHHITCLCWWHHHYEGWSWSHPTIVAIFSCLFSHEEFGTFLCLLVRNNQGVLFINYHKYTRDFLGQAHLQNMTHVHSPLKLNAKYTKDDGVPLSDPTTYRKLVTSLTYLTIKRPDISHAVNLVGLFMTLPTQMHLPIG